MDKQIAGAVAVVLSTTLKPAKVQSGAELVY